MKKMIIALVALITLSVQASAMSYEQARQQALFLTDKMAYELNLTDDQYEAAYEINLDYLMGINTYDDLYGTYWQRRNLDLSYILFDWQYNAYVAASYFYRPLYWNAGYWHFAIYARYPHRDYFYYGRPAFYATYRGGHAWHMNGGRSWYHGRTWGAPRPDGGHRIGMRDGFDRGDYGRGFRGADRNNNANSRTFGNGNRTFGGSSASQQSNGRYQDNRNAGSNNRQFGGNRSFGNSNSGFGSNNRESSTRATVTRPSSNYNNSNRSFGGNRSFNNGSTTTEPRNTFAPNRSNNNTSNRSFNTPSRSFGNNSGASNRSFNNGSSSPSRSFGGGKSNGGGHFGGRR